MEIKPISNNNNIYFSKEAVNNKEKDTSHSAGNKVQDKLELSAEAKIMNVNKSEDKKLELIKSRISSNFYNSDEVLNKVADALLKEINQK